jgi:Tol biopolymer transport system component
MVTGRQAFHGETVSDTLAAVLTREPDWAALPLDTSPSIRRLLRRCLERNPKNRVHDVADARIELDEAHAPDDSAPVAAVGGRRSNWWLGVGGALLAAFATWLAVRPSTPAPSPPWRFALGGLNVSIDVRQGLALSPDGRKLVYRGRGDDGVERLYVRSFDGFSREALPGTEQGGHPFFSPDGDWVGFFALGSLKKVALAGGSPQTLCSAGLGVGGTWLEDGTIVFVGDPEVGLQSLPASGGRPETILSLEPNEDISLITSPSALPAGNAVLCVVRKNERFDVAVFSLASRELHVIAEDGFSPMYVPTGHVLYQQGQGSSTEGSALLALPFDPERLEATGPAFPALTAVGTRISYQTTMFAVAPGGTLAYIPQTSLLGRGALVWIDRKGRETPVVEISKPLDAPRLSPDGKRVAFRTPAPNCDIWIHDLARGSTTRLTLEGDNHGVVWSPDGRRIAFGRAQGMDSELLTQATDGSGNVVRLAPAEGRAPIPSSFSPDGSSLLVRTHNKGTSNDIDLLATGNTPRFKPLITTPFDEGQAVFSPDGRLIAYVSNESGRYEVYVQTYPAVDGREQVSTDGGIEPVWSRDGKELFFRRGRELAAVDIRLSPTLSVGKPRVLFEGDFVEGPFMAGYDVSPDGRRFIMARGRSSAEGGEINVVLNWHQELLEKVPVK